MDRKWSWIDRKRRVRSLRGFGSTRPMKNWWVTTLSARSVESPSASTPYPTSTSTRPSLGTFQVSPPLYLSLSICVCAYIYCMFDRICKVVLHLTEFFVGLWGLFVHICLVSQALTWWILGFYCTGPKQRRAGRGPKKLFSIHKELCFGFKWAPFPAIGQWDWAHDW